MRLLLINLFFIGTLGYGQDLKLIPLTTQEVKEKVQYHYQYEYQDGHVGTIDLLLLKNGTFKYFLASNVYYTFSTGRWKRSKDIITLNSDIQKNELPIKIIYRSKDSSDFDIKKISFIKDLKGNVISYAFVYINNDSTSCMDGDILCIGSYKSIDSIRVGFENYGISSKWIQVNPFDGIIQIIIQTHRNLRNYIVFNNVKYRIYKSNLKKLKG